LMWVELCRRGSNPFAGFTTIRKRASGKLSRSSIRIPWVAAAATTSEPVEDKYFFYHVNIPFTFNNYTCYPQMLSIKLRFGS
jgi:hypothetical protein